MRRSSLLLMFALALLGCEDRWSCDDDEAVSMLDGKCTPRKSAAAGSGGATVEGDGGGAADASGVDAWVAAHGKPCARDTDCSPLASFCSTQLRDKCETAGCCVSRGCDENDPSTCPANWHCLFVAYGVDETFCVPN